MSERPQRPDKLPMTHRRSDSSKSVGSPKSPRSAGDRVRFEIRERRDTEEQDGQLKNTVRTLASLLLGLGVAIVFYYDYLLLLPYLNPVLWACLVCIALHDVKDAAVSYIKYSDHDFGLRRRHPRSQALVPSPPIPSKSLHRRSVPTTRKERMQSLPDMETSGFAEPDLSQTPESLVAAPDESDSSDSEDGSLADIPSRGDRQSHKANKNVTDKPRKASLVSIACVVVFEKFKSLFQWLLPRYIHRMTLVADIALTLALVPPRFFGAEVLVWRVKDLVSSVPPKFVSHKFLFRLIDFLALTLVGVTYVAMVSHCIGHNALLGAAVIVFLFILVGVLILLLVSCKPDTLVALCLMTALVSAFWILCMVWVTGLLTEVATMTLWVGELLSSQRENLPDAVVKEIGAKMEDITKLANFWAFRFNDTTSTTVKLQEMVQHSEMVKQWVGEDAFAMFDDFAQQIGNATAVPSWNSLSTFNVSSLSDLRNFLPQIMHALRGCWAVLATPIVYGFTYVLTVFLVFLDLMVSVAVFLAFLYILLRLKKHPLTYVTSMLPISKDEEQALRMSFSNSIKSTVQCTLKIFIINVVMTFTACRLVGFLTNSVMSFAFITSIVGGVLAVVPVLPSYCVCLPWALRLMFVDGEHAGWIVLVSTQLALYYQVNAWVLSDIQTNINSYIAGMSIVAGLYAFGLNGAVLGPLLMCFTCTIYDMYTKELHP